MIIISLLVLCKIALVLLFYDFNLIIYNINFLLSWFIIKILILTLALPFLTLATLISSDPYVAELKPYFINNKVHTNIEIKSKTSSLSHYNRLSIKKGLGPQIRYFSNDKQIKPKAIYLNPWWVTGFSDGSLTKPNLIRPFGFCRLTGQRKYSKKALQQMFQSTSLVV
jgi:hypothetical protein